jgi:hypothetical protein
VCRLPGPQLCLQSHDVLVDDHHIRKTLLNPAWHLRQNAIDLSAVIADHHTRHDAFGMAVLPVNLGRRHIELSVKAGQERLDPPTLFLQRQTAGQVEFQGQGRYVHRGRQSGALVQLDMQRYNRRMRERLPWLVALLAVFVLVGTAFYTLSSIRDMTQPVSDLTGAVGTQVAAVLQPTPTILPDPVTIVRQVRTLSRLETIEYSLEKVITAESGQGPFGFLFGDRLLLVAHGSVIAGVDLGKLSPEDVDVSDLGQVTLTLPAAEVFAATLDNHQTYVYSRDTGLLTKGNLQLETEARKAAEDEIRRAAIDDGILDQAGRNAKGFMQSFLGSLGFNQVVIRVAPGPLEAAITPTP